MPNEITLENKIMTAITKMLDNPQKNGSYEDYKCHNEIVGIVNHCLEDKEYALTAMRCLNKACLNNLSKRAIEIQELKEKVSVNA